MNETDSTGSSSEVILINVQNSASTYTPQSLKMLVDDLIRKNVEAGVFEEGQVYCKVEGEQVVLYDKKDRERRRKIFELATEQMMKFEEPIGDERNPNPNNRAARRGNKFMDPAVVRGWVRSNKHWKGGK